MRISFRLFAFSAAVLLVFLFSIAVTVHGPTKQFTGDLLGAWSDSLGSTRHGSGQEHGSSQQHGSGQEHASTAVGGVEDPAQEKMNWDPQAYDDLPLPDLEHWPGPDENGRYNDWTDMIEPDQHAASNENQLMEHLKITSKMTTTGRFMKIDWGRDHDGYNPGMIPHPEKEDTWIVIAQRDASEDLINNYSVQLYCEAKYYNNTMKCVRAPLSLAIAPTASKYCTDEIGLDWFNSNVGPHDGRLFHGLTRPYVMYNQQADYSCIGQWIHDARRLVEYDGHPPVDTSEKFFFPTNIQKPSGKYRGIEKNYFAFWDKDDNMYIHYTITPTRSFAQLHPDGSVSEDLGPRSAKHDDQCLAKLLPKLKNTGLEWIHQASNSLMITLCQRSDTTCKPDDDNTFLFTIFQTKTFYGHGQYEPYFMLFRRTAPFELYAMSKTPFWYQGRGKAFGNWRVDLSKPKDQSQMIFTTSMSWKQQGLTYHGYLDDELMICFGIEDKHSGVMDVSPAQLMADIATCDGVRS